MSWKKAVAIAALASISFTGNYLISASMVTAEANRAISAQAPGGQSMREWCNPSNHHKISWIAAHAMRDLDLNGDQKALFNKVISALKDSLVNADTLCAMNRNTLQALAAPQQLENIQTILVEAQSAIGRISKPFAEFHASLDAKQSEKFKSLMMRGTGRRQRHG